MEALKASLRKCAKKAEDSKVVQKTDEVKQLITQHVERLICFPVSSYILIKIWPTNEVP